MTDFFKLASDLMRLSATRFAPTKGDLFETAAHLHHQAIGVGLCDDVPFAECRSHGCVAAREALR